MAKRKPIRKDEYLAAALACLLPQEQRDALRAAKVPANEVIRLFSPDHIGLHCFEAPDRDAWHNISPMLRGPHKEKSKRDCTIAAKVKRLQRQFRPEMIGGMVVLVEVPHGMPRQARRKVRGETFGPMAIRPRVKAKIPSRPFPKRQRPMRWRDAPWPK